MLPKSDTRREGRTLVPTTPEWFRVVLITVTVSVLAAVIALRLW